MLTRASILALAAAAALTGLAPTTASAGWYRWRDIHADRHDIWRDRVDIRRDWRDVRRDVATGHYWDAAHDLADIRRDWRDVRRDRRDLFWDRRGF